MQITTVGLHAAGGRSCALSYASIASPRSPHAHAVLALIVVWSVLSSLVAPDVGRGAGLDEIYKDYRPDFVDGARRASGKKLQYSLQPWYNNKAYVEHDWRVDGILKKADELFTEGEYREAMKLYQGVVKKFPDDLWQIHPEGIFIPTALYAQRKLLSLPQHELEYYRTVYDPFAKPIFEKAIRFFSPFDFADLSELYLATGYGDDALFALGNTALDKGDPERARYFFERIKAYHRFSDVDRDELDARIAYCHHVLGNQKAYEELKSRLQKRGSKLNPFARALVENARDFRRATSGPFTQVRNPKYLSFGDYRFFPPPGTPLGRESFNWTEPLAASSGGEAPSLLPWVTDDGVVYKHKNVLYCRSLLTGDLKWKFEPSGIIGWYGRVGGAFYAEQELLIQDGMVFSDLLKYGPSLVAVDLLTGQLRWAAGPMAPQWEKDIHTQYQCAPAPGDGVVYAPYVYEEIAGKAHLSSAAGLKCFSTADGREVWSRHLCRLTPDRFTISERTRRIRILSTQPVVKDGVVYHVTNAGAITALDALSGRVRWLTRYPVVGGMHNISSVPMRVFWRNRTPIVMGRRMYATPVDSNRLFCLDIGTGKVLWSRIDAGGSTNALLGLSVDGEVLLAGSHVTAVDPISGGSLRNNRRSSKWGWAQRLPPAPRYRQWLLGRPLLTTDGHVFFSGGSGWNSSASWRGGVTSQGYASLKTRKTLQEKFLYSSKFLGGVNKNRKDPVVNTEEPFDPENRMTFRWRGVPFELRFTGGSLSAHYDPVAAGKAAEKQGGSAGMLALAELAVTRGERDNAIGILEKARGQTPEHLSALRFEINRQLFRLYLRQAQGAMQVGDFAKVETYCARMPRACTSSGDEIRTILALAELFERKGAVGKAALCFENLGKHYGAVKFALPSVLLDDQTALKQKAVDLLRNLTGRVPTKRYGQDLTIAGKCMEKSVVNYFSMISPLDPDLQIDTRRYASQRVLEFLGRLPASYRTDYESRARKALAGKDRPEEVESLIKEFPGTKAAQEAFDRMLKGAQELTGPERQIALWRLNELGVTNGLTVPGRLKEACQIRIQTEPVVPLTPPYRKKTHELASDPKTRLLVLKRREPYRAPAHLFFIGARAERLAAKKFRLLCWDARAQKTLWQTPDIRLKGKGDETGFEEYYTADDKVIVHGLYDVLAFSLRDGRRLWQLRVPHEFEIQGTASTGSILILNSRDRTIAVHTTTGKIFWDAEEIGALYGRPFLRDNVLIMARKNPSGVTFRSLATGGLLTHLRLPQFTVDTSHPILGREREELPIDYDGRYLVLTDTWDYILVDTELQRVRWQKRIGNVDRVTSWQLPYRLRLMGGHLYAVKKSYDTKMSEMVDTEDGRTLWQKNQGQGAGVVYSAAAAEGNVYGLQKEEKIKNVHLMGFNRKTGKPVLDWQKGGYTEPQCFVEGGWRGRYLVIAVKDKQNYQLLVFDRTAKKDVDGLQVEGHGLFGNYGEVSYELQGPYIAVLSHNHLTTAVPEGE